MRFTVSVVIGGRRGRKRRRLQDRPDQSAENSQRDNHAGPVKAAGVLVARGG